MRTALALLLLLLSESAAPTRAWAHRLSVEGAFVGTGFFPTGSGEDYAYAGIGASGTASYEIERWSFGIRTQGTISNKTPFAVQAGEYNLSGDLSRRQYSLGILVRYFLLDENKQKRWYFELSFNGKETDFVGSDKVFVHPESTDYTRLFLRGGGFGIGIGYRPKKGPWFFQVNYELDHYENLIVVGDVKYLNYIFAEPALNNNYFINTVFVTIGIDVFGRESNN